jgi:hypothetical protein
MIVSSLRQYAKERIRTKAPSLLPLSDPIHENLESFTTSSSNEPLISAIMTCIDKNVAWILHVWTNLTSQISLKQNQEGWSKTNRHWLQSLSDPTCRFSKQKSPRECLLCFKWNQNESKNVIPTNISGCLTWNPSSKSLDLWEAFMPFKKQSK